MEEPESSEGFSLPPNIPRGRVRQQRTVYSVEQREVLERFFENNHYPSYDERETLAARLNLREEQVQVWFKNRRAKYKKTHEATQQPGRAADASSQGPRVAVPAPAPPVPEPAAAGPGYPEDPVFASGPGFSGDAAAPGFSGDAAAPGFSGDATAPEGTGSMGDPGFYSPPPPNVFGGIVATETSVSSYMQAWCDPAQDAQNLVPDAADAADTAATAATAATTAASAPAAAPVWPEDPYITGFSSELFEGPTLADLLFSQDPLEGPSSLQSGSPDEEPGSEDDSGPKKLLDL